MARRGSREQDDRSVSTRSLSAMWPLNDINYSNEIDFINASNTKESAILAAGLNAYRQLWPVQRFVRPEE
jgi:hypothetical protein